MSKYSTKNAILDLGFIDGCLREHLQSDVGPQKYIKDVLDRMIQRATSNNPISPHMIYDVGIIRGAAWLTPLPGAYSSAMDRLMEYMVDGAVESCNLPQPFTGWEHKDPVLSDDLRDKIHLDYACEGREYAIENARLAGFDEEYIIDRIVAPWHRDQFESPVARVETSEIKASVQPPIDTQPSLTEPSSPLLKPSEDIISDARKSHWTPEKRAAAAERAKGRRKPPFDSDLESVKADFETGMSTGSIAAKWSCSDGHIRNFLMRNGIDPRREASKAIEPEALPQTLAEVPIAIAEQQAVDTSEDAVRVTEVEVPSDHAEEPISSHEIDQVVPAPITVNPYRPDPWDSAELSSEDWPDIQKLLAGGSSREAIAGDYDVPVKTLDAFIDRQIEDARQRRLAKDSGTGEARAPLQS